MKKLLLSAAIILGTISVQATNSIDKVATILSLNIQDEYTEVSSDAVPDAIKSTIQKSFPGTKLDKAYKNEKNEYKLEISNGEAKNTIYSDASGNIIKK